MQQVRTYSEVPQSGHRRRVVRVRAQLSVVVARADGSKRLARVIDVSVGGMHLECDDVPEYGEGLTIVVRLEEHRDWVLLPATVRWFTGSGFGIEFSSLDAHQQRALEEYVERAA